jgi:hypothetical protein
MKKEMTLKEFIDEAVKQSPISTLQLAGKLIELEAIEHYINLMYGVDLDIKVVATEKREGRFYGKGLIEKL